MNKMYFIIIVSKRIMVIKNLLYFKMKVIVPRNINYYSNKLKFYAYWIKFIVLVNKVSSNILWIKFISVIDKSYYYIK